MKHALVIGTIALASLAACARAPETTAPGADSSAAAPAAPADAMAPATTPAGAMTSDASGAPATSSDGNAVALGLLAAVDDNEIAAAKQALGKDVSAPVADYARMMEKEHTDNLAQTKALGTLSSDAEVEAQKKKGSEELAMLDAKTGKAYEVAYIDAMVKGHTEALALIDTRLLSLASTDAVKTHLAETRTYVAAHLQAAQALKASLAS